MCWQALSACHILTSGSVYQLLSSEPMRCIFAVLSLFLCLFTTPGSAFCQNVQPQIVIDAPAINFQMHRVPGIQVAEAIGDHSGNKRSGGTFYNPVGRFTIHFRTETDGLTSSCVSVTAVEYQLLDPAPEYWIAEELPAGSCIESELIAHELKHVAVFQRVYANFAAEVYGLIQAAIANYPVQTIPTYEQQTKTAVENAVRDSTDGLIQRLAQAAYRENLKVDHESEYDRLRRTCAGSLNTYLR